MRTIFFLLLAIVTSRSVAYAQTDSAALPKTNMDSLLAQYKQELADFELKHGHWVQTPNVNMHYLTWGKRSGMPLIWSHGTFGNAYEVYGVADSLVAAGYYLIAIDFYGHGLTAIPGKEVSLYHVADDIKALMDELKIKKAVIGGFSRGGSITTAFYDSYPNRVRALVLEDGGSVAWDVNGHKKSTEEMANEFINNYKMRTPAPVYNTELEAFTRLYNNNGQKADFTRIAFTFFNRLKQNNEGKWEMNPGVDDLVCEHTAEQLITAVHRPYAANNMFGASTHLIYPKMIYRNLDVPMLIFDPVSDEDWFDFEEENTQLQQSHPDLIVHKVYENTGHAVKMEHPQEFVRDMAEFLKTVKN
ncbi:alpha/beta fold hydrolase [Polluticoccus soli]|uniref:alpha/beta fold hydrolase n=1 Tax=Polluticoccus soli TaxID=3034150 RepID=UPI0023E109A5|nr:alpha/beta hydrolase [Flavipsychrobacter sp. JY13-12]